MTEILPKQCAIILVNYNNSADTLACLRTLYALHTNPAHIVVVDNASSACALQILCEGWKAICEEFSCELVHISPCHILTQDLPQNIVIPLKENIGFSGGNNVALRLLWQQDACVAFWILNNDTLVDVMALEELCNTLNSSKIPGICGSTIVYAHSPEIIQCAGGGIFCRYTGTTNFICGNTYLKDILAQDTDMLTKQIDWLLGASILIPKTVIEQVGFFAEEYFLSYEDVDYSLSVTKMKYKLYWASNSIVFHKEGGSSGAKGNRSNGLAQKSLLIDYLCMRNRFFLLFKFYPMTLVTALLSLAGVFYNRLKRKQLNRIPLLLKAVLAGLRGHMGKPEI